MILMLIHPIQQFGSRHLLAIASIGLWFVVSLSMAFPLRADDLSDGNKSDGKTVASKSLTMVVMDPLAAPLGCDGVKGYANRQYQRLGEVLESRLNTKVKVYWSDSLITLQEKEPTLVPDIVIGKYSVVESHGDQLHHKLRPFASLTDTEGTMTQRGLFVVRAESDFASVIELEEAIVFFGPEDCAEKCSSPKALLDKLGVETSRDSKTFQSCSEAAKALLALPKDSRAAAVISSYAAPLLEGCGTIKKGDLRVVGQTDELPFVTTFVNELLSKQQQTTVQTTILAIDDAKLLKSLESSKGFQASVSGI